MKPRQKPVHRNERGVVIIWSAFFMRSCCWASSRSGSTWPRSWPRAPSCRTRRMRRRWPGLRRSISPPGSSAPTVHSSAPSRPRRNNKAFVDGPVAVTLLLQRCLGGPGREHGIREGAPRPDLRRLDDHPRCPGAGDQERGGQRGGQGQGRADLSSQCEKIVAARGHPSQRRGRLPNRLRESLHAPPGAGRRGAGQLPGAQLPGMRQGPVARARPAPRRWDA